jgi:hypothetical protein
MKLQGQRFQVLVSVIALVAVASILLLIDVDTHASNQGGKGKGEHSPGRLQPCPECTDVCDPTVPPQVGEVCSASQNGDRYAATLACCCCGEANSGNYYSSHPK